MTHRAPRSAVHPGSLEIRAYMCILFLIEYKLIWWRYQLHPVCATTHCHSGTTDAHSQKTNTKKKSRYINLFLETTALTPPRQHQKFSFSKNDASKKETVHKHRRRPIIDLRFSLWRDRVYYNYFKSEFHFLPSNYASVTQITPRVKIRPGYPF
jgi:hypothetical protein